MQTGHGLRAQGAISGILGASVLALWFLIVDWIRGVPLMTPSALGSVLFRGEWADRGVDVGAVVGYSVFHYLAFILVGIAAAFVAQRAEDRPRVILAVLIFFTAMQAFALAFTTVLAEILEGTIRWWAAALGNLFAVAVMVGYLWLHHRKAGQKLDDRHVFDRRQ
jgi:heme/copper-type cytochrome/quinol oxidase subunit 4